ncbi:MAG: hypothetical protein K6D54_08805 [Bacteroidales bacterium]|nr:hypothetical protein [Bacteroidales bacterium]
MSLSKKKATGTVWIVACLILIGLNVAFFALTPHLLSGIAVILSNVITLLLAALAVKPLNNLLEASLLDRQKELVEKLEKDRELENKVRTLELENRTLADKLDTRSQTGVLPANVDYTFKLEQMEYAKQGYVVKEEDLASLDLEKFDIPQKRLESFLEENFKKEPSIRKILYIHKYYYKVTLGIDFGEILYAYDDDRILFNGVEFRKLHDISSEMIPEGRDIERCDILRTSGDRTEIRHDKDYEAFKSQYRAVQAAEVQQSMEDEVNALCRQYTAAMHDIIRERFAGRVDFVPEIDRDRNWYALKVSQDVNVKEIAANMLMLSALMNRTPGLAAIEP